jgi:hypothetical protein
MRCSGRWREPFAPPTSTPEEAPVSGVSDESRLSILAAAEREEARLHAEYDSMGTRETARMISGLRLSMLVETDPDEAGHPARGVPVRAPVCRRVLEVTEP